MAFNHRHFLLLTVVVFLCIVSPSLCDSDADVQTLINFRNSLVNGEVALKDWNATSPPTPPCVANSSQWTGLICNEGKVWGLQLEHMNLSGSINIDLLNQLKGLRTLSFQYNNFQGGFPGFKKLKALKQLYLSGNQFTGDIPDDAFDGMVWLNTLNLSSIGFTGTIPSSLPKGCPKLVQVRLDGNQFEGQIPDFPQQPPPTVNVSNNHLEGPIPPSLRKQDKSLFSGNNDLCGGPITPCDVVKKNKTRKIVMIIILAVLAVCTLLLLGALLIVLRNRSNRRQIQTSLSGKGGGLEEGKQMDTEKYSEGGRKKSDHGKLVFVRNDREPFDLNDLLKASAEVLGSGTFGSSYKAALMTGPVMVVKRFRQMNNAGRDDFQEHMRRIGRLRHPNLLPLVSYYYRKEEKLLVTDFVPNCSLAHHLHGNRTPDMPAFDWATRLKIIKGVARGLTYLYDQLPGISVAHGHLKSSNVLLNHSYDPLLMDYCLLPVISKDHAIQLMVAYKSPEYAEHGSLSKKTDVWSLGILILEMLTGKFPENYLVQGQGGDLANWVNSVVREEWTGEVFDKYLKGMKNGEGEMLKMLKVALCCCEKNVDKRWDLKEAVERIEELRETDNDSEDFSSYVSEGDGYSRGGMTEDDFSFSRND
ncbi:hypothetical protein ACHQM5_030620 [Ranunculus cassubicifolius]